MLTAEYDATAGIVRSVSSGFLTVREVQQYHQDLITAAAEARRHTGRLKLFIDATGSTVQSTEVMAAFTQLESVATDPDDRMAVVVASSLAKLQAHRNFRSEREKAFLSANAAMTWLTAY